MQVDYINPFIESTTELFTTMLSSSAERGEISLTTPDARPREVMALIGLSGMAKGIVAISFPVPTALNMVNRLLDSDTKVVDDVVSDAIAEFVNIIAGSAKARLSGNDRPPIDLSLPTVVRGSNYSVDYPSGSTWIEVPFTSELGPFTLRVTFEMKATT